MEYTCPPLKEGAGISGHDCGCLPGTNEEQDPNYEDGVASAMACSALCARHKQPFFSFTPALGDGRCTCKTSDATSAPSAKATSGAACDPIPAKCPPTLRG